MIAVHDMVQRSRLTLEFMDRTQDPKFRVADLIAGSLG